MEYQVRRFKDLFITSDGEIFRNENQLFGYFHKRTGYQMIKIKGQRYFIHRLVAELFLPGFLPTCRVIHKDGDKLNNRASNLTLKDVGKRGAYYDIRKDQWYSILKYKSKVLSSKMFDTAEEAYDWYYKVYLELRGVPPWKK